MNDPETWEQAAKLAEKIANSMKHITTTPGADLWEARISTLELFAGTCRSQKCVEDTNVD